MQQLAEARADKNTPDAVEQKLSQVLHRLGEAFALTCKHNTTSRRKRGNVSKHVRVSNLRDWKSDDLPLLVAVILGTVETYDGPRCVVREGGSLLRKRIVPYWPAGNLRRISGVAGTVDLKPRNFAVYDVVISIPTPRDSHLAFIPCIRFKRIHANCFPLAYLTFDSDNRHVVGGLATRIIGNCQPVASLKREVWLRTQRRRNTAESARTTYQKRTNHQHGPGLVVLGDASRCPLP